MGRSNVCLAALVVLALAAVSASASQLFQASLDGLQEVPPNASPGFGAASVLLNNTEDQISVDLNWSGLLAPATAAHIHGPASPGVSAAVIFPLAGVPAATAGSITTQTFPINASQVADLKAGLYYVNVHSSVVPSGEIRGQLLLTPEPASAVGLLSGLAGAALVWRKKR